MHNSLLILMVVLSSLFNSKIHFLSTSNLRLATSKLCYLVFLKRLSLNFLILSVTHFLVIFYNSAYLTLDLGLMSSFYFVLFFITYVLVCTVIFFVWFISASPAIFLAVSSRVFISLLMTTLTFFLYKIYWSTWKRFLNSKLNSSLSFWRWIIWNYGCKSPILSTQVSKRYLHLINIWSLFVLKLLRTL